MAKREALPRRSGGLAPGGGGPPVDPGHAAADARLWPDRQPGRPCRVDRREVPCLDGQRRVGRTRGRPRPDAGEHLASLVYGLHRGLVLAVLRADARALADPGRPHRGCANGLCGVSEGDQAAAARHRGAGPHRHPPLDGDGQGRAFRRHGAAGAAGGRDRRLFPPAPGTRGVGSWGALRTPASQRRAERGTCCKEGLALPRMGWTRHLVSSPNPTCVPCCGHSRTA